MSDLLAETINGETPSQPRSGRTMKFTFPPESRPLDGYTIKRGIDRGGFGEVYYAVSDGGKEVALKLLRDNLEIELRGVSQCLNLKHPNLVTIFDIRTDADGDSWIIMEYVRGKSLDQAAWEKGGRLSMDEIRDWLAGIAAGLDFLHGRGIVHRDLKPANVYRENGLVKIGDVGLAKFISESKRSAQTQSVGTVYYMAPEVAHGRYGREVDIYALGVVLYEMVTGRVPFDGESTAEILMKHLTEEPDLSVLPDPLRPVLARALEKDPHKRLASASQLNDAFTRAVRDGDAAQEIPAEAFAQAPQNGQVARPESAKGVVRSTSDHAHPVGLGVPPLRHAVDRFKDAAKAAKKQAKQEAKFHKKAAKAARKMEKKAGRGYGEPDGSSPHIAPGESHFAPGDSPGAKDADPTNEKLHRWLIIGAIIVLVMALIAPRALAGLSRGVFVIGIYAALAYGGYRIIRYFVTSNSKSSAVADQPGAPKGEPAAPAAPVAHGVNTAEPQPPPPPVRPASRPAFGPPRRPVKPPGPDALRRISLRNRLTELCGSLTLAVLVTALLTAGLTLFTPWWSGAARIALFGLTGLVGAWGVLGVSKLTEGTRTASTNRRIIQLCLGVLVGAAAFAVDESLLVEFTETDYLNHVESVSAHPDSILDGIGPDYVLYEGLQPTLAGYMLFFGGLFGLRRWWRQADAFRKKRCRLISVVLTAGLAYLWCFVGGFPVLWGVTWAALISSAVHLSAAWVPPEERHRLMEERRHA